MSTKAKILLVDDEPLVLDSLHAIVNGEEKYDVDLAENGNIAISCLRT